MLQEDPFSITHPKSRESGEVPTDWKLASVTPVYKKDTRKLYLTRLQ